MTLKDAVEGFKPTTEAEAALRDLVIVLGEMTEVLHREFPGAGELLYQRSGGLMTVAVQAATRMRNVTREQRGVGGRYDLMEKMRERAASRLATSYVAHHFEDHEGRLPSRSDELVYAQPRPLFGQSRELVKS